MTIGIFCGDSWETWSPPSVTKGIGGSEEAVIYLTRELAKLGHTVYVWNKCDAPGTYDGVEYIDYLDYDERPVDVLVGWRNEQAFKYGKNYKLGYLWLHDTQDSRKVLEAMKLGANKVMVLSRYHRRLYPMLRNEQLFLTRNGINVADFDQDVARVPHRMFWGSSYDRGLREVLENWPKIKLEIPDATLHIAYGWETREKMARANGPDSVKQFERVKADTEKLMDQEGITHLGRISHEQVAKELLEADVWGYPTWWPEISCITAMKAQAGGAIPVVAPTAAVAETVQYGMKTDRGYYHDLTMNVTMPSELIEQWVDAVLRVMRSEDREEYRQKMMSWARGYFSWEKVAQEWVAEFAKELQ